MELFNKLTAEELDMITYSIENYALPKGCTVSKPMAPLSYILREWADRKTTLAEFFGGELILEKKINYTYSFREKIGDWVAFAKASSFIRQLEDLYEVHTFHSWSIEKDIIINLLSTDRLYENTYKGPEGNLLLTQSDKTIKVQKGARCSRILKKIAEDRGLEDEYEEFRICHSKLLQEAKTSGTLCLSIHPLDYITMSDNSYNWSSCMSWKGDGCYRQGTVEMMNSPYVVVAYLKGQENYPICFNHCWNSKRWRELFIVTPKIITGIKSYPYHSNELEKEALTWLKDIVNWEYEEEIKTLEVDDWGRGTIEEDTEFSFETDRMYNDFCNLDSCTIPCYIGAAVGPSHYINYSGRPECMWCGALDFYTGEDEDEYEKSLVCCDCYEIHRCDHCGDGVLDEEELYELSDGHLVCPDCYHSCTTKDPITDGLFITESMVRIYLAKKDTEFKRSNYFTRLYDIEKDAYPEETWYTFFNIDEIRYGKIGEYWWEYYVTPEDLTEIGLKTLFDLTPNDLAKMDIK